jgi:pimeloyl-ACP methyl ester carboxylesterase
MRLTETDGNPAPPGSWVDEIITADGIRLRAAHWPAIDPTPRGTVLILQGRTEFIEKYFETVADLLKRGFAVVAFDWRSQGRSQRLAKGRCHVESFADYDRDLDAIMRQVVLPDCPQPLFALAHSMGALAALRAARDGRVRFDRMVLLAPMLELSRRSAPPMGVIRFLAAVGLFFGRDNRAVANRALRERYEPEEGYRQEKIEEVQRPVCRPRVGSTFPHGRCEKPNRPRSHEQLSSRPCWSSPGVTASSRTRQLSASPAIFASPRRSSSPAPATKS